MEIDIVSSSCLSILYGDDYQFINDYKITLKTIPFELSESMVSQMQTPSDNAMDTRDSQWMDMSQKSTQFKRVSHQLVKTSYPLHTQQIVFYCLSPSVAFAKDLKLARSSVALSFFLTLSIESTPPFLVSSSLRARWHHWRPIQEN